MVSTKWNAAAVWIAAAISYVCLDLVTALIIPRVGIFPASWIFASYLSSACAMLGAILMVAHYHGSKHLRFLLTVKIILKTLVVAMVILTTMHALLGGRFSNPVRDELAALGVGWRASTFILVCILGPVLEEVLFRGYVFELSKKECGSALAWLITVVSSAAAHLSGGFVGFEALTFWIVATVVLTFVYQVVGLSSSIAIHALANTYVIWFL